MRTDEAFKILKNAAWLGSDEEREAIEEAVTMACNALATIEQITWERKQLRTDGDCISRRSAIDAILGVTIFDSDRSLREYTQKTGSDKWCEGVIEALDAVAEVPSVQPDLAQLLAYECGKASAQPEQRWILCSERMPEEREWLGTKHFGTTKSDEVYVTFDNPKGERFCEHLSFQNGKLSGHDQLTIDAFYKGSKPIAWMPLPEPYKGGPQNEKC